MNKEEIMDGRITNRVKADNKGWENICLSWAQAREAFEIHGIAPAQFEFCRELCDRFDYELNYDSSVKDPTVALLIPRS